MKTCCRKTLEKAIKKIDKEIEIWKVGKGHWAVTYILYGFRRTKEILEDMKGNDKI